MMWYRGSEAPRLLKPWFCEEPYLWNGVQVSIPVNSKPSSLEPLTVTLNPLWNLNCNPKPFVEL